MGFSTQTFTVKFTSLFKTLEFIKVFHHCRCMLDCSDFGLSRYQWNWRPQSRFQQKCQGERFSRHLWSTCCTRRNFMGSDTSTSFDPSYGNQDTTFFPAGNNAGFGSNPVGVGFGVNGDLGYGNLNGSNGLTLKGGLGGISFNFIVAILALLGLTQLFGISVNTLLDHNPIEDFKEWFASDAAEAARNISPEHVQLVLNNIEAFAQKFQ